MLVLFHAALRSINKENLAEINMINRLSRAKELILKRGFKGFSAQLLRYVAFKIETSTRMNFARNVDQRSETEFKRAGRINTIGAVIARTIPDSTNPSINVPFEDRYSPIEFERVAVVAHIFYPELTAELISYLKHIPVSYGLFITTDSEDKRKQIQQAIAASEAEPIETEIRIVPNRGRDIAPKYIGFADIYQRYPAFLHIHSKQSLHAGDTYSTWRSYLLKSLLGSREIAESNLKILSNKKVGVVYPEHAGFIKPVINWGYDFPIARDLMRRIGVILDVYSTLEFPSGSMYWGRSEAIGELLGLNLAYSDFPEEAGQVDGTLAHAIERSLLLFVEKAGFQWARVKAQENVELSSIQDSRSSFNPLLTSSQTYIPTTQQMFPETLRIVAMPKVYDRKRLNLIVPSLRAAEIFGGIDTALKVFRQLEEAASAEIDFRVIVSDAPIPKVLPSILAGYSPQYIGSEVRDRRTVVDATDRTKLMLEVSPNDIFIATAWWTALNAFRLHDFQKTVFNTAPRVVYLIQDFEPGFYGWSTKYALADATYKRANDTVAIFNSEELEQFFAIHYQIEDKFCLPYRVNANIDAALKTLPRERILLFYSRPSAARNCFESGIDGLALWARRNPDKAASWKIYCIGETFPQHRLGGLENVIITGKMPLEEYGALLSRASVGLSLMVSPHPSYPPLEMAYAGISTITNSYECKNLTMRSKNIMSLDEITPESIADNLEVAINNAEQFQGLIRPIRCSISDIETGAAIFSPEQLFKELALY